MTYDASSHFGPNGYYETVTARLRRAPVDEQDDELLLLIGNRYLRTVNRRAFSYASWFIACRSEIDTPISLMIRAGALV